MFSTLIAIVLPLLILLLQFRVNIWYPLSEYRKNKKSRLAQWLVFSSIPWTIFVYVGSWYTYKNLPLDMPGFAPLANILVSPFLIWVLHGVIFMFIELRSGFK